MTTDTHARTDALTDINNNITSGGRFSAGVKYTTIQFYTFLYPEHMYSLVYLHFKHGCRIHFAQNGGHISFAKYGCQGDQITCLPLDLESH